MKFLKKLFSLIKNSDRDERILEIIKHYHAGVFKRIDENRETLEIIIKHNPSLLKDMYWLKSIFKCQDDFLCALANQIDPKELGSVVNLRHLENGIFPRKYPLESSNDPLGGSSAELLNRKPFNFNDKMPN